VLFDLGLMFFTSGAAILAALTLCDHSATGAVPPRGQMHRVVVILSGLPSIGPGGMPRAADDAAVDQVLTQQPAAISIASFVFIFSVTAV
jgi:hypothetical protein